MYIKRVSDRIIEKKLKTNGAVLITGVKYCGKTSSAKELSKSSVFFSDTDQIANYKKILEVKPSLLLEGEKPRLFDEWQTMPLIWDTIRNDIDKNNIKGGYILTGSSTPNDNIIIHSGTGRIARILMHTMSLYESSYSTGDVSIKDLFDNQCDISSFSKFEIDDIAEMIIKGGWPANINFDLETSMQNNIDYIENIINVDMSRIENVKRSPGKVRALLKSLARNISTLATQKTIRNDIAIGDDDTLSENTVSDYLNALDRLFITENIEAFSPRIRSKTVIRTSPKRQLTDPSIACSVLRLNKDKILQDLNYFGFLFESLCERDLRIYTEANDGSIFHYHDKNDLEVDCVIALNDGRYGLVEIKLGNSEIEKGEENLLKLANKIDTDKMAKPSFLMVVTATGYAYKRSSGVIICPITCLKD